MTSGRFAVLSPKRGLDAAVLTDDKSTPAVSLDGVGNVVLMRALDMQVNSQY